MTQQKYFTNVKILAIDGKKVKYDQCGITYDYVHPSKAYPFATLGLEVGKSYSVEQEVVRRFASGACIYEWVKAYDESIAKKEPEEFVHPSKKFLTF
jgi:hypothetical protein